MQSDGNWQDLVPRIDAARYVAHPRFPLLARFLGKFVFDVLPAALASVIGGFLFTQYHLARDHLDRAATPPAEQMSPASAEVLALVRDEHQAIVGFLKTQMAAEKSRLAAQDADTARAVADAKAAQEKTAQEKAAQETATQENEAREKAAAAEQSAADIKFAAMASTRHAGPVTAAKVALPRAKPTSAPMQVAAAAPEQTPPQNAPAPATDRVARDPDSLLAKTLDLKDQVVAATKQAVTALGDAFASVGERIGGGAAQSARPFSSDS